MKVTVKETTTKTTNANSHESTVDLEEQISRRAYELYERRGCEAGHETEDWLQAEAELARERAPRYLKLSRSKPIVNRRLQAPEKEKPSRLSKSRSSAHIKTA